MKSFLVQAMRLHPLLKSHFFEKRPVKINAIWSQNLWYSDYNLVCSNISFYKKELQLQQVLDYQDDYGQKKFPIGRIFLGVE